MPAMAGLLARALAGAAFLAFLALLAFLPFAARAICFSYSSTAHLSKHAEVVRRRACTLSLSLYRKRAQASLKALEGLIRWHGDMTSLPSSSTTCSSGSPPRRPAASHDDLFRRAPTAA
jgi:hypothetical protein